VIIFSARSQSSSLCPAADNRRTSVLAP
jgi:hypothetical protein